MGLVSMCIKGWVRGGGGGGAGVPLHIPEQSAVLSGGLWGRYGTRDNCSSSGKFFSFHSGKGWETPRKWIWGANAQIYFTMACEV